MLVSCFSSQTISEMARMNSKMDAAVAVIFQNIKLKIGRSPVHFFGSMVSHSILR
jgi:hypothetical protein